MSTPQINPQDVFRATLPLGTSQILIFVPSLDRDGKPINQDHWVDQILTTLGNLFRGAQPILEVAEYGATINVAGYC